ncbi:hypothetical protein [Trichlorobacter ammonificans]|uniref:Uncharacterized protein n=1 Tax=Trichlorobacter ammonificans TaxID=2916410 RepID=A0ABN8HKU1_9BACT|nr:hypothetical protein [Trichlorobacter ammonificans]CAH2032234.1 conserved exported protein of unknown function [Trichlorobacter ammonificans]
MNLPGAILTLLLVLAPAFLRPAVAEPQTTATPHEAVVEKPLKEHLFGSHPLGWADLDWEVDLYYSNLSLNIPLTDQPLRHIHEAGELEVYSKLFVDSLIPRFMMVEAAVMPLPLAGAGLKEYARDLYKAADIGREQNVIQWVTAGFEEPWAFSFFVGDMVRFDRPGESRLSSNKGYMGYLLSYSNQHIKNNVLVPDHSLEAEWKLKGERSFRDEKLSWSFRVGAKIHDNTNISNTVYLGARRSDLDFRVNPFEFLKNSTFDLRIDFSQKNGRLIRQEYVLGKKFPITSWGVALKLDIGLIWEDPARYAGTLRDRDFQNLTLVLRPNIQF